VIGFTGRGPRSRNLILEKGILLTKDNELPVTEPGEGRAIRDLTRREKFEL
jgi:hypothetical protein